MAVSETLRASEAPPVSILAGRYRIEQRLGRGGMGSVWRAEHLNLHSPVAVKVIDPSLAASDEARARFLREARAAAMLRSPHVVQVLDHGIDGDTPYLVMELLEGESLAARIERIGKLTVEQTTRIMTHVARAMTRAHAAGIVHRDLKPENVFLVRDDDEEIAKVLEFGIAKAGSSLSELGTGTRTGTVMGTPHYMSPEQIEGSKEVDHRSDLWAMAVMTFECLTGTRPFDGPTLGGVLVQICAKPIPVPSSFASTPPALDTWFLRATTRDPEGRYQSAKELAEELRKALASASLPVRVKRISSEVVERKQPAEALAPTPQAQASVHAPQPIAAETEPQPAAAAGSPSLSPIKMSLSLPPVLSDVPGARRLPWPWIGAALGVGVLGLGYVLLSSAPSTQKPNIVQPAARASIVSSAPAAPPPIAAPQAPPPQAAGEAAVALQHDDPARAAAASDVAAPAAVPPAAEAQRPAAAAELDRAPEPAPAPGKPQRARSKGSARAERAQRSAYRGAVPEPTAPPEPVVNRPAAPSKPDLGF